jgi:hypothetical protein
MQMMQIQRLKEPAASQQAAPWSHFQWRTEGIPPHEYGELTPRLKKCFIHDPWGYGSKHRY